MYFIAPVEIFEVIKHIHWPKLISWFGRSSHETTSDDEVLGIKCMSDLEWHMNMQNDWILYNI